MNKAVIKKYMLLYLAVGIVMMCILLIVNTIEYKKYMNNYNSTIAKFVYMIKEKYGDVDELDIINALNDNKVEDNELLEKYGIYTEKDTAILGNKNVFSGYMFINSFIMLCTTGILFFVMYTYTLQKERKINEITECIRNINNMNYEIGLESMSEDELSILKNEIYKTTIILKESAINSKEDRNNLKKSLEDISHQLKTPITSLLVMLDDMIDDYDMDNETRIRFARNMKRETSNMSFLVQNLLKLSKFDANTITFKRKSVKLSDLVGNIVENVSVICDFRNIKLNVTEKSDGEFVCDRKWQVEALTNILKNSIEYSYEGEKVDITYEYNELFSDIIIRDYGQGISKEDEKHLFERFYKGKNSKSDSVGIGLSLAKRIINEDNGIIEAVALDKGSMFKIRYYY